MPPHTRIPFLLTLLVGLLPPAAGVAQAGAPATLRADGGFRLTSFRGEASWMGGADVLLRTPPGVDVGAGGWLLLGVRPLDPDDPSSGVRMRVAYGGLVTGGTLARRGPVEIDGRLLLGAGNATIELPVELSRVAADNFLVIEPELAVAVPMEGPWAVRLSAAYRRVAGVENIYGVTTGQLSGGSLGLSLSYHGS